MNLRQKNKKLKRELEECKKKLEITKPTYVAPVINRFYNDKKIETLVIERKISMEVYEIIGEDQIKVFMCNELMQGLYPFILHDSRIDRATGNFVHRAKITIVRNENWYEE